MKFSQAIFFLSTFGMVQTTFATNCRDKTIEYKDGKKMKTYTFEFVKSGIFVEGNVAGKTQGMFTDKCEWLPLETPQQAALAASQANPNNPAAFCGRRANDPGPFDPYYINPGQPVMMAAPPSASSPPPVSYMEIAFPGDTVTVNGVTGVLDNYCNLSGPTSNGDPHFKTWGGDKFDFHGGCDLVLIKNPGFANGKGLDIHVRTQIKTWWSFIESAAIRIGENTVEISGTEGGWIWFNGEKKGQKIETGDAKLGEYDMHSRKVNDHQTITRLSLGSGTASAISIETYKNFVRVNIKPAEQESFEGTVGILGSFPSGKRLARDGATIMEDNNEFGQEWMVHPDEPNLFHDADSTTRPLQCDMPDKQAKVEARRRLGEMAISEEDAALACARVTDSDRDACIFDVLATNDTDMAGSY